MSTKHLLVCDYCAATTPVRGGDQNLGRLPTGWLAINQGEGMWAWHVCSFACLRKFGDSKEREWLTPAESIGKPGDLLPNQK